jgi:hypothetical protein
MPAYAPSGTGSVNSIKVTVTNVATRLQDLVTTAGAVMPYIPDERYTWEEPVPLRLPYHLILTVPVAAANPIYVTWDNNTAPVATPGGPGMEMLAGLTYEFENAGPSLMIWNGKGAGIYQCNTKTAFQFIATGNTLMTVTFSD